jgi:glycerate 2-kinase
MGGSATNDGGAGALQALGVYFADASGKNMAADNAALGSIVSLHTRQLDPRWQECDLLYATDVDNPALGEHGATAVFAPQKGAAQRDLPRLEANLKHFFQQIRHWRSVDVTTIPGGGAAGALAAGLMAFLGGRIASGIELLLTHNHFDDHLQHTALVITGEGQLDAQTLHGKGPLGIARRAANYGVPTIALVGSLNAPDDVLHEAGFQAVLPIMDKPMPLETALERAEELLERAALRLGYILQTRLKEE